MNKRYQVFVSSTYEDLKDERLEVMKALLELDCIPCGMEYFPASNEDAWTFIKSLIDTCDYYIVIVGGCYGSEDDEGVSYTQKEYEYAIAKDIPIIGFYHGKAPSLPPGKQETDAKRIQKLSEFTELVRSKLCKPWTNAYELGAVVSRSLTQLMKSNPRTGWVRADKVGSEELLGEVNVLRKDNQRLQEKVMKLESENSLDIDASNVAFNEHCMIGGTHEVGGQITQWSFATTWRNLFVIISPYLIHGLNEKTVQVQLMDSSRKLMGAPRMHRAEFDIDILQSIKVQFLALRLIQVDSLPTLKGPMGIFWTLTSKGQSTMLQECSIKKKM